MKRGRHRMGFTLTSPSVTRDQRIEPDYTCDGNDAPPPLQWSHAPDGTASLAVIMDDPDAPGGTFTHWLLWDVQEPDPDPDDAVDLASRGVAGRNDFHGVGYRGPCPPANHGPHRYRMRLYALDVPSLELPAGSSRRQLEDRMAGHIIDTAELVGVYQR